MIGNVLITGVSSGIGWALAREYLLQGVRVIGVSRREPEDLQENPKFKFESVDLRSSEDVTAVVRKLLSNVTRLDLLVLNAGVLGRVADMEEISARDLREVLEVNLVANKVVLDSVFGTGVPVHQVVAISSGAATMPNRGWNAYAISKAALNMMVALYALERPETHFAALAPGIVDTAMQDQISEVQPQERFASLELLRSAKGSPMMPSPEIAAARLVEGIAKVRKYPSGSFLDIRSLAKRTT